MSNELFVLMLGVTLVMGLRWGFRNLPGEEWQFLAAVPRDKEEGGVWRGTNFTYYGLFNAVACVLAVAVVLMLLGAVGVPRRQIFLTAAGILLVSLPAARIVAGQVEGKAGTFTVGGAAFVGMLSAPAVVWAILEITGGGGRYVQECGPTLAALAVSYAFGEGVGRLACISFGCCYGKPVVEYPPLVRALCRGVHFTFTGKTKKIAYAHGLEGVEVFPVQGITSVLYTGTGLVGTYLFLCGHYREAFLGAVFVSQVWRFVSEFLRADYRGEGKISAYQYMSAALVVYGLVLSAALFEPLPVHAAPELMRGLKALWDPAVIVLLQCLWVTVFLYTGRSLVTEAVMSFHVRAEKV